MGRATNVNIGKIFIRTAGDRFLAEGTVKRGEKFECIAVSKTAPQSATLRSLSSGISFETAYSSLHRSYDIAEGTYAKRVVANTVTIPSTLKRTVDILLQDREVYEYVRKETGANEVIALRLELAEQKRKWEELRGLLIGGE